jgi:hypothetical protein
MAHMHGASYGVNARMHTRTDTVSLARQAAMSTITKSNEHDEGGQGVGCGGRTHVRIELDAKPPSVLGLLEGNPSDRVKCTSLGWWPS